MVTCTEQKSAQRTDGGDGIRVVYLEHLVPIAETTTVEQDRSAATDGETVGYPLGYRWFLKHLGHPSPVPKT